MVEVAGVGGSGGKWMEMYYSRWRWWKVGGGGENECRWVEVAR